MTQPMMRPTKTATVMMVTAQPTSTDTSNFKLTMIKSNINNCSQGDVCAHRSNSKDVKPLESKWLRMACCYEVCCFVFRV